MGTDREHCHREIGAEPEGVIVEPESLYKVAVAVVVLAVVATCFCLSIRFGSVWFIVYMYDAASVAILLWCRLIDAANYRWRDLV